jgi:hypothetical protein
VKEYEKEQSQKMKVIDKMYAHDVDPTAKRKEILLQSKLSNSEAGHIAKRVKSEMNDEELAEKMFAEQSQREASTGAY